MKERRQKEEQMSWWFVSISGSLVLQPRIPYLQATEDGQRNRSNSVGQRFTAWRHRVMCYAPFRVEVGTDFTCLVWFAGVYLVLITSGPDFRFFTCKVVYFPCKIRNITGENGKPNTETYKVIEYHFPIYNSVLLTLLPGSFNCSKGTKSFKLRIALIYYLCVAFR